MSFMPLNVPDNHPVQRLTRTEAGSRYDIARISPDVRRKIYAWLEANASNTYTLDGMVSGHWQFCVLEILDPKVASAFDQAFEPENQPRHP